MGTTTHIYKSRHYNTSKKVIVEAWCKLSTDDKNYSSVKHRFTKDMHGSDCVACQERKGMDLLQNLP